MRGVAGFLLSSALGLLGQTGNDGYIDPAACAGCHKRLFDSYRRSGMGRSFYRAGGATVEDYSRQNTYFHEAAGEHFTMSTRNGRYFQRRHELDRQGRETNVLEFEAQFVLGSGNHVRSYVHRTTEGQLVQLPVAWYAEKGGFWAMNPGYERVDHMEFGRKIDQECLFCHAAYRRAGGLPAGIDCQRCHGPGGAHVAAGKAGGPAEAVRGSIVNPGRLSRERQLEVCFQCHLESSSRPLPYSLRRYGREFFSYRPGEPLADYMLHFDRTPAAREDGIEIAHSAYRLLQSACFRLSATLTCVTCHNPHEEANAADYRPICRGCHAQKLDRLVAAGTHPGAGDCVGCHMPKRPTTDVQHVSMTDHFIQRRPEAGAPPARQKEYRGEVVPLYPKALAGSDLPYLAVAQVTDGANLPEGISRLRQALETYRPEQAEFYLELAQAYGKAGETRNSLAAYEQALQRQPRLIAARRGYAAALSKTGRQAEAIGQLRQAVAADPRDAGAANQLGEAYLQAGRLDEAVDALRAALRTDSTLAEAYVNLGAALSRRGKKPEALEMLSQALLYRPNLAAAHSNLASLLEGDFSQAEYHLRRAIRGDPENAAAHYNYGRALFGRRRDAEARVELESALRLQPEFAEAEIALGLVLARQGDPPGAIAAYRRAVRIAPRMVGAHYNLALVLLAQGHDPEARQHLEIVLEIAPGDLQAHYHLGDLLVRAHDGPAAIVHFRKAAESNDAELRAAAEAALRKNLQVGTK